MSGTRAAPPQLIFDDGSRIMTEESTTAPQSSPAMIRGSISLEEYYEIDRISREIPLVVQQQQEESSSPPSDDQKDKPILRVALQFPDELLDDSPEVCWMLEEKLLENNKNQDVMVFCLGDTTVGSCCPDEVAALHLQASVLVHYGHACLSPTGTLPVIYSFGKLKLDVDNVVEQIQQVEGDGTLNKKLLVLYHVGYHHAMEEMRIQLTQKTQSSEVVLGQLPKPALVGGKKVMLPSLSSSSCCGGTESNASSCCGTNAGKSACETPRMQSEQAQPSLEENAERRQALIVGGLELPESSFESWDQLSEYTVLFIGDPESATQRRQYVNTMLRFLSLATPPQAYWTYIPSTQSLSTSLPNSLNLQLKRRFFLTQKARDAHVFGIVVSNLSQQNLVQVVKSLEKRIQNADKASYNFAVGKINPAKLANFAEIECFVLVACREHSLLDNEREYHVPIITPLELDIALGNLTWGGQAYSLDCLDVLTTGMEDTNDDDGMGGNGDDDDDDAPYFSLVTGKYVHNASSTNKTKSLDLEQLPGKGQVTAYNSEAANFLKQREYQGLEAAIGQTEVKAAVPGQQGIASNYGGS